jgi:hypothetical protein
MVALIKIITDGSLRILERQVSGHDLLGKLGIIY